MWLLEISGLRRRGRRVLKLKAAAKAKEYSHIKNKVDPLFQRAQRIILDARASRSLQPYSIKGERLIDTTRTSQVGVGALVRRVDRLAQRPWVEGSGPTQQRCEPRGAAAHGEPSQHSLMRPFHHLALASV